MMSVDKIEVEEFWLFHDSVQEEIDEIRKLLDPELDLTPLYGIDKLIDRLNHLLEEETG